jgi:hypothetical protein
MPDVNNDEKNKTTDTTTPQTQNTTITPAMIDSEGDEEKVVKQDLSGIIPSQNQNTNNSVENILLNSKDKELKSDGSVVLGYLKSEDEVILQPEAVIPEPIDIAKRKEEIQKNKHKKQNKKEPKRKLKTKEQILQNKMSLVALAVIAIIVATVMYIYLKPDELDFEALTVKVELGERLPTDIKSYIKPSFGTPLNEMAYTIDKSAVVIDKIGEYQYTVMYKGIMKTGIVQIVDETPPDLTVISKVTIREGQEYAPETFLFECIDRTGCDISFEDKNTTTKYKEPGTYVVFVIATDPYGNKTTKKATLVIESTGMARIYKKIEKYDESKGYSKESTYDLHYSTFANSTIIIRGTYTEVYKYQDDDKYQEARKLYNGELNYTIDDNAKTITYKTDANTVGHNYSDINSVHNYLIQNGYSEG